LWSRVRLEFREEKGRGVRGGTLTHLLKKKVGGVCWGGQSGEIFWIKSTLKRWNRGKKKGEEEAEEKR